MVCCGRDGGCCCADSDSGRKGIVMTWSEFLLLLRLFKNAFRNDGKGSRLWEKCVSFFIRSVFEILGGKVQRWLAPDPKPRTQCFRPAASVPLLRTHCSGPAASDPLLQTCCFGYVASDPRLQTRCSGRAASELIKSRAISHHYLRFPQRSRSHCLSQHVGA